MNIEKCPRCGWLHSAAECPPQCLATLKQQAPEPAGVYAETALSIVPGPFFSGLRSMFLEYGNPLSGEGRLEIANQFERTCSDMCETWEQVRAHALRAGRDSEDAELRLFLDAAGGEGLVLNGIDAGDLYVRLYGYEPPPDAARKARSGKV